MSIVSTSTTAGTEISARIIEILESIDLNVEDGSTIDPNEWTGNPLCQLLVAGEEYDEATGERPDLTARTYNIKFEYATVTPAENRQLQEYWGSQLRANINITNINSSDKLARIVIHEGWDTESYDGTLTTVNYGITVKYRDETTC